MGPRQTEIERRIVSVLFCDLAGFTSLSERLDAEDVAIVQNAYFSAVRDSVTRHGGTLEKFIGDAAVAVFGVPVAREQDAERAVRSGLAVVGAVEQLAARVGLEDGTLHVRVGVNTGEAVVHPAPAAGEAMVTGDVVNTAARLQSAAPLNGVLVGPETALAVAHAVELEEAAELLLKGKAEPVRAVRVLAVLAEPERERAMGALRAPTIGREDEISRLTATLDDCAGGAARQVTVVAPPGTGKSRLLEEVATAARSRGAAVRRARVRPDALSAFGPVAELLHGALDDVGAAEEPALHHILSGVLGEERAGVVAGEVSALLGHEEGAPAAGEADARRAARFAAWSDALGGVGDGVEIWLVEDVHWSSRDFRAFLETARSGGRRGRLVVCTSRPSLLDADPDWCAGQEILELDPLSAPSASELVRALVGDALPPELTRRIAEMSGGNPLFVEELLRAWAGSGLVERRDGGWMLARAVTDVALPSTVQSIYAAQLDDLPPSARTIVRRASVAGRQFPSASLRSLEASAAGGVDALLRRGIVAGPVADAVLGECFVFRHALLRDVGYASLARAERARLHIRMAEWLESRGEERPAEVAEVTARHYAAALESAPALATYVGDGLTREAVAARAARWFEDAGRAALGVAAYDTAAGVFRRALELTDADAPRDRARRLLGLAQATAFTSDMDAGLRAAEEALGLLRPLALAAGSSADDIRDELSRAVTLVGAIYAQQLRFRDVVSVAEQALEELGDRGDAATVRLLLTRILGAEMIGDEAWRRAAADRERSLELAAALRDPELEFEARRLTALDVPTPAAWSAVEELATRLHRWPDVAEARRVLAGLCLPDDPDGAERAADRLASFATAHQLDESVAWAEYYRAEAGFVRGSWDDALSAGLRALAVAEERSYHRAAARTWHVLVPIAAERAERDILDRAVRWYGRLEGHPETPYGLLSRAAVDVLLGRAGAAPRHIPDLEQLQPSFDEGVVLPSWLEAVDTVVAEALAAGEVEFARAALATLVVAQQREAPSAAGDGVCALIDARLAAVERGDDGTVRNVAASLRAAGLPWFVLKCLRLLAHPSDDELAETRALEANLGIRPRDGR